jgi:hypothetical protein
MKLELTIMENVSGKNRLFIAIAIIISSISWIYDFLILFNYESNGGYSITGKSIWFHERNVKELSVNILLATLLLLRAINLNKVKYNILNLSLIIILVILFIVNILINNWYFWGSHPNFISDLFKIITSIMIGTILTIRQFKICR